MTVTPMHCGDCDRTETDPIMLDVERCGKCGEPLSASDDDDKEVEQTTIERVRRVMAEYFGAPEAVPHDHTADLGIDSLDQIEIGIALEDEFEIEAIADEDMWGCNTIHDWIELVERMLSGKAAA